MSKFTRFNDAITDMLACPVNQYPFYDLPQKVANGIRQGQRFFMPYGGGAISDRKFSDFFDLMKLPYPITVVTADSVGKVDDGTINWIIVCHQIPDEIGFDFYACFKDVATRDEWFPAPPGSIRVGANGKLQFGMYDCQISRYMMERNPDMKPSNYFGPIVSSVIALCVMLSLKNVKTDTVSAPSALNAKRKARGQLPLYSYKVLNVDGESWDSDGVDSGYGQGYRSHLRRGHIRRISDDRAVWVRATYVHGRIPGFVDKDYNVVVPE